MITAKANDEPRLLLLLLRGLRRRRFFERIIVASVNGSVAFSIFGQNKLQWII